MKHKTYVTNNAKATQRLGEDFAKEIVLRRTSHKTTSFAKASAVKAVVLGFSGNLGGGKTTFLQGFAKGLGIKEKILSPTFVIMKRFHASGSKFHDFYHIDCYRLKDERDILELGWKDIISNPKNIVAVEWPEKIKKALPKNTIFINFKFLNENKREISFFDKEK